MPSCLVKNCTVHFMILALSTLPSSTFSEVKDLWQQQQQQQQQPYGPQLHLKNATIFFSKDSLDVQNDHSG